MNKIRKFGLVLLLGFGLSIVGGTSAFADDIASYRESIHDYQARLSKLKTQDPLKYSSEMASVSEWIEQALILIGRNELQQVKSLVVKSGVYLEYIEVSIAKDAKLVEALNAETELKALKAEYGKLEAEVQQLEAEESLLTKKIESMTQPK